MHFLVRLLINAAALWVATHIVQGIAYQGHWASLLAVALVFGVLNASVRPLIKVLTFPLLILTLGLFTFVINALMVLLVAKLVPGFAVRGFWSALLFSLIVSVVVSFLNALAAE